MNKVLFLIIGVALASFRIFGGAVVSQVASGLPAMEHSELLPLFLPEGTETRQSSSYDPSGIELQDIEGHALAPIYSVSGFEEGKWLRFQFTGSIQIQFTNGKSGSTAVLSAMMFEGSMKPLRAK